MKAVVQSLLGQFNESNINEAHPKLNSLKLGKFVDVFRSTIDKNKITKPGNKTELLDAGLTIEDIDLDDCYQYLQGSRPWKAKNNGRVVAVAIFNGTNPLMLVNLRNSVDTSNRYTKTAKSIVGYDLTSVGQEQIDAISSAISKYWGNGSINNKSDFNGEIRASETLNLVISSLAKSVPDLSAKVIYEDRNFRYNLQASRKAMRPGGTDSLDTRLDKFKKTKLMPNENRFKKGEESQLIKRCVDLESNGKARFADEVGIEYDGLIYVLDYVTTDGTNNLLDLMSGAREGVVKVYLKGRGFSIATTATKSIAIQAKFVVSMDDKTITVKDR